MMNSSSYPTFRKRLLIRVGVFVGLALLLIVGIVWIGASVWLRIDATRFVQKEADEIASYIVRAGNDVAVDRYMWNEPHHLFDEVRIDPLFVQVLDKNKQEVFATVNVGLFPDGAYPRNLVGVLPDQFSAFSNLETRFIGNAELYFTAFPIRATDRTILGYIQIARFLPNIQQTVQQLGLGALAGSAVLLFGLLVLIYVNAGRLLSPLQAIAKTADSLSADHLDSRIPDLENADRESVSLAIAFNRLLNRLSASFDEMKRFNANASHQLQTPLTVLKGHIDVTLRKERTVAEYQKTLQLASDETNAMVGIVSSLMQLSRLESNPTGISKEPVHLSEICNRVVQQFTRNPERIRFEIEADLWILSQPDLCSQFIRIFVDNAMKYDPDGVVVVTLKTGKTLGASAIDSSTAAMPHALFSVEDQGFGIGENELELVRERFFRGQAVRDQRIAGDGLGLALADQIAKWQGVAWELRSTEKGGTLVTCNFPIIAS